MGYSFKKVVTLLIYLYALFCFLLLLLFTTNTVAAQQQYNLVPNWSFEDSVICPAPPPIYSPIPKPWYYISSKAWFCQFRNFNRCSQISSASVPHNFDTTANTMPSYQEPKTGDGYSLISTYSEGNPNGRIYIQAQLRQPLISQKKYWCSFWVSNVNVSRSSTNNIAMLITQALIYADTIQNPCNGLLSSNPQIINHGNPIITDTLNWVRISGIYTAIGGEKYITLGNFKSDILTDTLPNCSASPYIGSGYYVDDVSVIPLDSFNLKADAGSDTTITIGDSAFIGTYTNGIDTLKWKILATNNIIDTTRPGFWVKPLVNTCYTLTQTVNGFTSSDTVCINVQPLPLKFLSYELSLRGTKQSIENLWQTANEINVSHFNVQRSINNKDFTTIGKLSAQNKNYNDYSFIDNLTINEKPETLWYRIESIDKDGKKQYSETKSLNIQHSSSRITIYPNPAKDIVTISSKEKIKELSIINQLGQVVYSNSLNNNQSSTINIQGFAKGLYIVKIITIKGELITEKLIIE